MVFCLPLEALAREGYNKFMKRILVILVVLAGLIGILFSNWNNKDKSDEITRKLVTIGQVTLEAEIADTNTKRENGLSWRKEILPNEGMLFVFDREGYYGFWMKDMNFSIDIIWLDKNKKIIHTEHNVTPQTYPKTFNSPTPSLYVLETAAGFSVENNIKIGDFIAF